MNIKEKEMTTNWNEIQVFSKRFPRDRHHLTSGLDDPSFANAVSTHYFEQ